MEEKVNEEEVGTNLKDILKMKGISMKSLAEEIGVSTQQVSKYCSGRNEPNIEILAKTAKFLGVSVEEIYPDLEGVTRGSLGEEVK